MNKSWGFGEQQLQALFECLQNNGYTLIGPRLDQGIIKFHPLNDFNELPRGIHSEQTAGNYRLQTTEDGSFFQWLVGPDSFKRYLHPPRHKLFSVKIEEQNFSVIQEETNPAEKLAFWGVRSCDLASLAILDRVLLDDMASDEYYRSRRANLFIVAASCTTSAASCFCTSMGDGPEPRQSYDVLIQEYLKEGKARHIASSGSAAGDRILHNLCDTPADENSVAAYQQQLQHNIEQLNRNRLDTTGLAQTLKQASEHPHWDEIAARCISCANCTMVCPTCFCITTDDRLDLTGEYAERWLTWDSCFNTDFSYIHGGAVRPNTRSQYRHWLTHKISTWHDQFDSSGCVGCGRCITWCPVGIDLRTELKVFQEDLRRD